MCRTSFQFSTCVSCSLDRGIQERYIARSAIRRPVQDDSLYVWCINFLARRGAFSCAEHQGRDHGTVTDTSGAQGPNATVTITNAETNVQRTLTTNGSGIYDAPSLAPGVYSIKVATTGFRADVRNNVELQVGQVARFDFELQVGNVSDTVEVQATAATLDTETASVGTVIESKRISDLPLNGRNYLQLASLVPGATTYGPGNFIAQARGGGDRANFQLNVSGQRLEFNHYMLDGIENTDPNYRTYLLQPSVDALQEFKLETSTYSAETAATWRRST
jgi:hypothetical protein